MKAKKKIASHPCASHISFQCSNEGKYSHPLGMYVCEKCGYLCFLYKEELQRRYPDDKWEDKFNELQTL